MHTSAFLTAALAASAVAFPFENVFKREYVTELAYVTVTQFVTAGSGPASSTEAAAAPATPAASSVALRYGRPRRSSSSTVVVAASTLRPVAASSIRPAASQAPASSSQAARVSTPAAAPPSSTQAAAPTVSAASSNLGGYAGSVVNHHNMHRANHSSPDLVWDQNLANIATEHANTCIYKHNVTIGGGGYGQNIAAGAPADNITSVITELFYNNEMMNFEPFYGQATPSDMSDATFDGFGHFTQIVWKGTTKVGCATVDCHGKGNGPQGLGNVNGNVPPYFTVCNYGAPGNYLGEFNKNVQRPIGKSVAHWNS